MKTQSIIVVSTLLASCLCYAKEACTTPNNVAGNCESVFDCPPLKAILNNKNRTPQEVAFLKKSQCGFRGTTPTVCCPPDTGNTESNECYNADNNPGTCVDIDQCKHLKKLMNPPVSQENMNYLQRSKCTGPSNHSVCCGPEPVTTITGGRKNCKDTVSAYPPDPSSGCCGKDSSFGNKIYGGTATGIDEYPWLALIDYEKDGVLSPQCGGVLISGRYVLTAGHCVKGEDVKHYKPRQVRLSEYDKTKDGPDCAPVVAGGMDCTDDVMKIPIETITPHPEYDPTQSKLNDIALIRLAKLAPFTDFIRPICLPSSDLTLNPPEDFTLYSAGWGQISVNKTSDVKMHVDLPYVPREKCQASYRRLKFNITLWEKQVCAGGEYGKDSCRGDSGGPLMYENGRTFEVLGLVSFGPKPCGIKTLPGVHSKVFAYKDWILSNIKP